MSKQRRLKQKIKRALEQAPKTGAQPIMQALLIQKQFIQNEKRKEAYA